MRNKGGSGGVRPPKSKFWGKFNSVLIIIDLVLVLGLEGLVLVLVLVLGCLVLLLVLVGLVLVLVLGLECLVLVLEGQVLGNITSWWTDQLLSFSALTLLVGSSDL